LLVGYSQGAQVTGDVVQKLSADLLSHVLGVALFGDPYFNTRDYRVDRGNHQHLDGLLGTRPIFTGVSVLSYCHKYDPICQGPLDYITLAEHQFKPHENYPPDAVAAASHFSRIG
jgi:Cutinase